MQLHFSYVYLIPLAAFSLGVQCLRAKRLGSALFFILGAVPPLVLIVPTFLRYGLRTNDVASGFIVPFSFDHVQEGLTILARFLSLVSFEVPLFAGGGVQATVTFLLDHVWILLPGALLCVVGLLQPFLLLFSWFRKDGMDPQWIGMRRLVLAAFFMVYASFWFTVKIPRSHIYFIFFPLLMVYSCHCYLHLKDKYGWRLLAKAILVMGIWFQLGYAIAVAPKWSLYLDRSTIQKAITEKDYKLFGERRPASFY